MKTGKSEILIVAESTVYDGRKYYWNVCNGTANSLRRTPAGNKSAAKTFNNTNCTCQIWHWRRLDISSRSARWENNELKLIFVSAVLFARGVLALLVLLSAFLYSGGRVQYSGQHQRQSEQHGTGGPLCPGEWDQGQGYQIQSLHSMAVTILISVDHCYATWKWWCGVTVRGGHSSRRGLGQLPERARVVQRTAFQSVPAPVKYSSTVFREVCERELRDSLFLR